MGVDGMMEDSRPDCSLKFGDKRGQVKKNMAEEQGIPLVYIFDWSYVLFATGGFLLS
jgi:hypothetical protein